MQRALPYRRSAADPQQDRERGRHPARDNNGQSEAVEFADRGRQVRVISGAQRQRPQMRSARISSLLADVRCCCCCSSRAEGCLDLPVLSWDDRLEHADVLSARRGFIAASRSCARRRKRALGGVAGGEAGRARARYCGCSIGGAVRIWSGIQVRGSSRSSSNGSSGPGQASYATAGMCEESDCRQLRVREVRCS